MALRQLFQRLFDASTDSDIPKNVPFTLVINTLLNANAGRTVDPTAAACRVNVGDKTLG